MGVFGIANHVWADSIAGFFAFCAITISLYEVYRHIKYPHRKQVRRYIIRILFMVPVYAIEAWFGTLYPSIAVYLNAIRDIYEVITHIFIYIHTQSIFNELTGNYHLLILPTSHQCIGRISSSQQVTANQ